MSETATVFRAPTVKENPGFEILYWIGCAGSYDRRAQRVTKSVVKLLNAAGVNFAILGSEERCTGDSARRIGDEFLFQELAQANIAPFSVSDAAGPNAPLLLRRASGAPLTAGVAGAYTRAGYAQYMRLRDAALTDAAKDAGVLGREEAAFYGRRGVATRG